MPRIVKPLSDTQVRQAKPAVKEYNLADGKGLYLRVKPIGSKMWLFNYYRPFTKQRANLSLGTYPALSLQEAREAAQKFNGLLINNTDPQEFRREHERSSSEAQLNTAISPAVRTGCIGYEGNADRLVRGISVTLLTDLMSMLGERPDRSDSGQQRIDLSRDHNNDDSVGGTVILHLRNGYCGAG